MAYPRKITVIFRTDTEERFLYNNTIPKENEICIVKKKNGKKYLAIGDGKNTVNKCKKIRNFPYSAIVLKKDPELDRYIITVQ